MQTWPAPLSLRRLDPAEVLLLVNQNKQFRAVVLRIPCDQRRKRLRPAAARQEPSHDSLLRIAAAAELVFFHYPRGEIHGLLFRLALVLWQRHPLTDDRTSHSVLGFHESIPC